MDDRETLTPSSGDAILKRHLFSGLAKNWIKDRGDVGRAYFVRRPSRQSFGFRVAASSGPIPKAPGSAGGYLPHFTFPLAARTMIAAKMIKNGAASSHCAVAQHRDARLTALHSVHQYCGS